MRRIAAFLVAGAACLATTSAFAGPRDFLVQMSTVGVSSETAQSYIDTFLRYTEDTLKWPAKSLEGALFPDAKSAVDYINSKKPGFAMLDPEIYFELRKKEDLSVLAEVHGKDLDRGHLSLVVKGDKYKSLDDLKGKTLTSNHLASLRFVSKVVFDGKIDVGTHFKLNRSTKPMEGLKALGRDEVDATLLDDAQLAYAKGLPFGGELKVLYTSAALPSMPLVALGKNSKKPDRDAVGKMVLSMCSDAKGAEVCKALRIEKFSAPEQAKYDDAQKRFEK